MESTHTTWERFWAELPAGTGQAVWDGGSSRNAAVDLARFGATLPAGLPLLDVGCGNGVQTDYLAGQVAGEVIGLDFSAAAVDTARQNFPDGPATFRRFDLVDDEAAAELHDQLGDCNVYIRTVLHNIPADLLPRAVANLARLLGDAGLLYAVELSPAAGQVFAAAAGGGPDAAPKLKRAFDYQIVTEQFTVQDLDKLLTDAGLTLVEHGDGVVQSAEELPDGTLLQVPCYYVLARRAG